MRKSSAGASAHRRMGEEGARRPEWLTRILDAAEPGDAVELIRHLNQLDRAAWPPWRVREDRLHWRDAWVRVALGGIDASSKAPVLAGMLKRRAAARTPAPFGTREGLLDRILALSGGKALSGRQIAAIAAGDRR